MPVFETFDKDPGNYGHEDEADQVSAGGSGNLAKSAGKTGKNRQAESAQQQIDKKADGCILPSEYIDTDQQNQICK